MCNRIFTILLYSFILHLFIFPPCARSDDFSVTPFLNTSDIAIFEVTGDYDAELPDGMINVLPRQLIAREFYKTHPDNYDFLVIFTNFDFRMPETEAVAFYQEVRNDVQGIGKELIDNTSLYGSDGVLQGTIDMGNINSLVSDLLDPGFSDTMGILSHELYHRWAANVRFREEDGNISGDLLGKSGNHWSFLLDTAGSLEYGNQWVDNGNNTFTALAGRRYFSPLDLYLMGLIDKSEVPSMLLIDNPEIDPERLPEPGVTIAGTAQYVTVNDIVAAEGERIPDVTGSQKNFRIGCIFITRSGTYSDADLTGIRNIMESWSMWFSGLTDGHAKIVTDNYLFAHLPENSGPVLPVIDPRTAPPEINDGVAWLLDNQHEDGSWQDSLLTAARDTSAVLFALTGYDIAAAAVAQGIAWLENSNSENLDYLARKIYLLGSSGRDAAELTVELQNMQNPDGGWGSSRKYESSPADTALALQALSTVDAASSAMADLAITYLLSQQNADSGWGTDGRSAVLTTIDVIAALLPFRERHQLDGPIQNALGWVYAAQNPDGGFGNSPSTMYGTARTLIVLKLLGITSEVTDRALAYILDHQEQNGSWLSSAYQTSLAVNAIWMAMHNPDLSVSTTDIVPNPATVTNLPVEASISVTVRNAGMEDVEETSVVLYEGGINETNKTGETTVAVSGQSSETVVFNATITRNEPQQYYVLVDPDNLIRESSEQNNSALRILYPESTYDFSVSPENISISPAVRKIYEPLSVSFKVKNTGTVDAFSVPVHLAIDDGNGQDIVATEQMDLPAGNSIDHVISWMPEISGTGLVLSVVLDPHDSFAEVSEDNNTASAAIDVNASEKPDLFLSPADISFHPSPALEAGTCSFTARVHNRGFSAAESVQVDFYDTVTGEDGNVLLGSATIPVVAAGGSADAVIDWAGIPVSGERVISVIVDRQNTVDEIVEENNSAFATLRVLTLPDFAVSASAISFSPEAPREGDPVIISAMIHNRGEQPGANIPVAFYEGNSLIGTATIPEIEAGRQAAASLTFLTDAKAGITAIKVVVNPENTIPEQDVTNNMAVRSFGIQNGDLWLSHNFISPNGDGVKDSTAFGCRLAGAQDVRVEVVNEEGEVVREYAGQDFTDTSFVSLIWDGLDNKGRVVADGPYRIQVLASTGSVLASLLVTVDTNRSSLLEAVGTPYLFQSEIHDFLRDNRWIWLPDESGILFYLETPNENIPDYPTGLYTMSPTGGNITRIVPWEWNMEFSEDTAYRFRINSSDCEPYSWGEFFPGDQVNPGFSLAEDGVTIAFILEQYDKISGEILASQLWTVDRFGEDLSLIESYEMTEDDQRTITDIFWSPDGSHLAVKSYDRVAAQHRITIMRANGSDRVVFTPDWTSGKGDNYALYWSPDGKQISFAQTGQIVVADLSGHTAEVMPVGEQGAFINWLSNSRILVRDLTDSSWAQNVWIADLNTGEQLLLGTDLERPVGIYDSRQCIRAEGQEYNAPVTPSGHFLAAYDWSNYPYSEYLLCNAEGNCRNAHILDYWWSNFALSPGSGNMVHSFYDGLLEVFDLETEQTDISVVGDYACSIDWESDYPDMPDSFNILPQEEECDRRAFMEVVRWNWLNDTTYLAYYFGTPEGVVAFDFATRKRMYLPENWEQAQLLLSPGKRFITYASEYNRTGRYYATVHVNGSLLNLTADLHPGKTDSAVTLQGTTTDLNFSSWSLEYADQQTPDDWRIITPSEEKQVVNGILATWIPPYDGSFLVRLTVTDKAGNRVWDRSRVTWGKKFSVTDMYKTGELFSPNADGIKDTVGLNYLVHEPVHLEVFVHDEAGALIRTFNQDHALPGEYGVVWDGRDESGGIVPDGFYTIRIFGYEFFVQVDTTPPAARLEFSGFSCEALSTFLSGLALDEHLKSWTVYYGVGENPPEWYVFASGEKSLGGSIDGNDLARIADFSPESSPPIGFLGNTAYRMVVEDRAGNKSVVVSEMQEEMPLLARWDDIPVRLVGNGQNLCVPAGLLPASLLEPDLHTLAIVETLGKTITEATIQYRMYMQWHDAEILIDPPDGGFDFDFDTAALTPEDVAAVRVKFVDGSGLEYYSNTVVFNPPVFTAEMGCIPMNSLSPAFISMDVLLPESLETLRLQATRIVSGAAAWEDLDTYTVFDGFPYQLAAPTADSLPEGYGYPLRFVGITESGRTYTSNELPSPPQPCPDEPEKLPPPLPVCDSTSLRVSYSNTKAPCNTSASGTATIAVGYCPDDGPQVLPDTVRYYLEENGEMLLLKQFDIASAGWGSVTVETAGLSEGEHQVRADLVYGDSVVEGFRQNTLIVDRTLPEAKITYPSLSAPFCTRTVVNEDGEMFRYVDVEGTVADQYDQITYSLVYGAGAHPGEWFNAHDSTPCSPEGGDCTYFNTQELIHVSPGVWDVSDLAFSEYSLQLSATDRFGNTSCFVTQADIDRSMSLAAEAGTSIISPNADGTKDDVSVEYHVGEYGVLNVTVSKDNAPIRTLVSKQEIINGSGTITWDGRDDSGGTVPDGNYQIQVVANDLCGNMWREQFSVTVDNTPPTAMILYPGTDDPLNIITEVTGTAFDEHFLFYQLQAQNEAGEEEPVLLSTGDMIVDHDILGSWNTFGLEGNWELVLTAEDRAGNIRTTKLPVSLGTRPQLIKDLRAAPGIFSPDNDGKFDATTVTYELSDTANITIVVEDIPGNTIVSEIRQNTVAGIHQYQWAGLNDDNTEVPDGVYRVKVRAESLTEPFVVQAEQITVIIDTLPPAVHVMSPQASSYQSRMVNMQGSLSDPNLEEYAVTLSGGQDSLLVETAAAGSEIIFTKSLDLPDGVYAVQVDAVDAVQNTNSVTVSFTVDKTRPRIMLEGPVEDEYYGGTHSVIPVKGIIDETNLLSYHVQYGSGTSPSEWVDLAVGEEPPPDNMLAAWSVGPGEGLADGDYTVRVTAIDKAGWESAAQVGIHIDNNPPELAITKPEADDFVKDVFDITGTVQDPFLQEYTLAMADSVCSSAGNWSTLRTGEKSITDGRIFSMQMLPADGEYCLRLSATDLLNNTSEHEVNFAVDTTPPFPPRLSGRLDEAVASLEWQGNTESDLAGYTLYRNGVRVSTALLTDTYYRDQEIEEDEYTYVVRAVDLAGWASADSNQVAFTIDFTLPEARINSPRDGFRISNFVDITGRAYSEEDFKEYRVSYGAGTDPQTWELLRISPVPVSYGTLVRWDVISLEDGPYTIRLEAEDLNGNISTKTVAVTVDNTPPAAPVLLAASPEGSTVDLTWQANSEPDLAGYLAFRNGQPANISGMVVGDLTPYLITALDYTDTDVPDGTHDYYLVALDSAGNMSDQSNSIQVMLDTRPPHLSITAPAPGLEFDKAISVKAESEDTDIDTVRFQYRPSGATTWTDLGGAVSQRPYVINLDPPALGWEYGFFRLRAVATDLSGLADETPQEIEIHFRDITPPAAPSGVSAQVNAGIVTLSWSQGLEEDLSGYNVYLAPDNVLKNTELLTESKYIDPNEFPVGEYEFSITAVDASGNKSERSPVTATVFAPVLKQPPTPVDMPDLTVQGNTVPEASVQIIRNLISGTESLGTTQADAAGLFALAITLSETENRLHAVATDPQGNISRPSNTIAVVHGTPPAAPTGLVAEVDNHDVHLAWKANSEPDLAGYNIYRKTSSDWQKINASLISATSFADTGLRNDTYTYRATAVDTDGFESSPSNESTADIEQQLPAPPSYLVAQSAPEGSAVDLCWNSSVDPVEGYRVYRSLFAGGPYTQVRSSLILDSCFLDTGLTNGTGYFYVVRSVDAFGNESNDSNEVSAVPQDTLPPDKPLFLLPTVGGRPYQSPTEKIDITGFTETGAAVDLIQEQEWIDAVDATVEPTSETTFLTNYRYMWETVATPDGKRVFYSKTENTSYPYDYYIYRKDLETGVETFIDQIPEGSWNPVISPDGTRLLYCYRNESGWDRIAIYDLISNVTVDLTTNQDVDEYDPAWSRDGTKIVFDTYQGPGLGDFWMYDVTSGEISLVTGDFPGFYPEIAYDNNNISFVAWDSITRQLRLYLVNEENGEPVLLDEDVDWTGYYPSVEWSPTANKLAFTASRDGVDDIYVYDVDTGQTSRLTATEQTEIYLQWSPDGKYISYYMETGGETEVRMISVDGQADDHLLQSFPGNVASDFNWLPAGIFYRADHDLHRIVPPGYFIFKEVGLHPGRNVFTATAEDAAGHVSEPAHEIVVDVDADVMPDLEVLEQDIYVLPNAPLAGDEVTFNVVVRNTSSVPVANIDVDIYIWDANDNVELIHSETLPSLDRHSEEWLSINWDSTAMAGTNKVYVLLDSFDDVAESNEENNMASRSFYVAEEKGLFITTSLNGGEFWSDEIVSVAVDIHNSGPQKDVQLTVLVEDEKGYLVDELTVQNMILPYGGSETLELDWRAGSVFAGAYQVRTILEDTLAGLISEEKDPFTVMPDMVVNAALTTDRLEYGPDEEVRFDLSVVNEGANIIIPELQARLTIVDSGTTIQHVAEHTLYNLYPLDSAGLTAFWNTVHHAPGSYTATVDIFMNGELVDVRSTEFAIVPVTEISGSVSVEPKVIFPGGGVHVEYTIANSGNTGAGSFMIELLVLDTRNWTEVASHKENISLGMDERISGQHGFTIPWDRGVYQVILKAVYEGGTLSLANDSFTVRDGVAPQITIQSPGDGSIVGNTFELSVLAADDTSGVARVEYRRDNGSWLPLPLVDQASGRYAGNWSPVEADEGRHILHFRATDNAGNESLPVTQAITIRPRVDMSTATDQPSYGIREDVAVSVNLTNIAWEKHAHLAVGIETPDGSAVARVADVDLVLGEDQHQSLQYSWNTGTVDAGDYRIRAIISKNGVALAETLVPFVVDRVLVLNGTLTLTDTSVPQGDPVSAEWSVTNDGNFSLTGMAVENTLSGQDLPQLQNRTETITLLRGQTGSGSFQVQTVDMPVGSYQLSLVARYESESFALAGSAFDILDTTPPVVTVVSPAAGTLVNGPVEVGASAADDASGVDFVEYSIDRGEWQPLSMTDSATHVYAALWTPVEDDEGSRTVSFRAGDRSGNISEPVGIEITVELCNAFAELAGSLNVSPRPLYYSQDVTLPYTITNRCNKTLDSVNIRIVVRDTVTNGIVHAADATAYLAAGATSSGSFVLSSLELQTRKYTAALEVYQADKTQRTVAESSFVILPAIDAGNSPQDETNLLVWINNAGEGCYENDDHGGDWHGNRYADGDSSHHRREDCESQCSSYALVESILNEAADYSMIVCSRDDFEGELRNPFYSDIMIIGDSQQLTGHHGEELREKVYSGTGLISFGWHVPGDHADGDDNRGLSGHRESFLGVAAKGVLSGAQHTVFLAESPVSEIGEMEVQGHLVRIDSAENTEVAAWVTEKCSDASGDGDGQDAGPEHGSGGRGSTFRDERCTYPLIVLNEYGQGRTLYVAFDLCRVFNSANEQMLTDLLMQGMQFIHRPDDSQELVPNQIRPYVLEVGSPGLSIDLLLSTFCAEEITLFDPAADDWVENYPWVVTLPIVAGETKIVPYYVLAPNREGDFLCEMETGFVADGHFTLLQKFMYKFAVGKDRKHCLEEAVAALNDLEVTRNESAKRDIVLQYLQRVLSRSEGTREQAEQNIHDIGQAVNALLLIESIDIHHIRLQLDMILRIEQGRSYFFK